MVQTHLTPAVAKPDHVPDRVVFDYDHHNDPALRKDAHARILEIAMTAPPIFWTPRHGGHWVLRGHAAVYKASRDPDTFSNAPMPYEMLAHMNADLPDERKMLIPLPITVDPPHHNLYRGPLLKPFSPKAMLGLRDSIRDLAGELIEKVRPDGGCEFMTAIAEPLPVTVFLKLFGLPVSKHRIYRDLVAEHLHAPLSDSQGVQARLRKVAQAMNETILERRDHPQDDIISMLWQSEYDGKPATLHDIENYAVMLFIAGLDTVMNGMGLGVRHLAMDLPLQARLRANPALVPEAGEELLRRYTFTVPPRFLLNDAEFEGLVMKKGEMALLFLPAADLDPTEFSNPDEYNLARENKVHIAFGTGPHRCLGSHLARIELQVLYEEMLKRLPEFRLDPDHEVLFHGGHVIGPDQLYLLWDA